jgi:hypothetical protein
MEMITLMELYLWLTNIPTNEDDGIVSREITVRASRALPTIH